MTMAIINGARSAFTIEEFERIADWMRRVGADFVDDCGDFECTAISESAMIEFDIDPDSDKGSDMFEIAFHVEPFVSWHFQE